MMPRDPRAYLQRAEEHRRHGRLKEAIALSIEALGKHPGLDAVRVTLGRAYLENAQPEEARTTLQDVFARLPEHHLAGKLLVESQRLLGDLAAAASTCRTLLEHYPRDREIEPILAEIVRAQATPGTSGPAVAPAPREEADPEPDYLPEDLGAARAAAPPAPVAPPPPTASPAPAPTPGLTSAQIDKAIEAARPEKPAPPAPAPKTVTPVLAATAVLPATPVPAAMPAPPATPTAVEAAVASPAMTPPTVAAAPPMAPVPVVAPAASASAASKRDALETNTLAELYVKQGLPDRAIEVYRSMLRVEPGNVSARRRLAELEAAGAAAPVAAAKGTIPAASKPPASPSRSKSLDGPAPGPVAAPPVFRAAPSAARETAMSAARPASMGAPMAAPAPAAAAPSPAPAPAGIAAGPERAAIDRLARWLDAVKRGQKSLDGGAAA
jgi:pentatricopeptide repeat protein